MFKERLCSMAPQSKSKSNPSRISKRNVKKVDKQSHQNLKMDWMKMVEQRAKKRKRDQNRKSAQVFRSKKAVDKKKEKK